MGDPCVFFIKFPTVQKFCHVVLQIENQKSTLQNQVLKCRQLLFLCHDVIASPNVFDGALLDVVMNVAFFKEKKVLPYCKKLGLKFRISSHWNAIGQFLVKGPDVVRCSGRQDAVDVDVTVSHEQVTLTVRPHAIRNSPPALEDFSICFQALQNFHHLNQDSIEEFSIYQSWCHVMPSMKKGQLVKVSRKILIRNVNDEASTPVKDYDSLKKYWKNHHGIKLPETEDGMLYGSIYFKLIGPQLFTYPLCCLRTKDIQILPRCDGPAIIKDFMGVLTQKMDRVCGFKLMFSSKPCYVNSNLSEVSQIVPENFHNVSTAPKDVGPPPPHKPPVDVAVFSKSQKKDVILPSQSQPSNNNTDEDEVIPSSQVPQNQKQLSIMRNALRNLPTTAEGKYIPSFVSKKKDISVNNTVNCGKKIEAKLQKKKPPGGVAASATVSKKYKTPQQINEDMNDSGYCADETPIASNHAHNKAKSEKKLQPKKLCFDQVVDSSCNKTLDPSEVQGKSGIVLSSTNKLRQYVGVASELQHTTNPSIPPGNVSELSPLKMIKNHSFDQLFVKAGDHSKKGNGGTGVTDSSSTASSGDKLKILKSHMFDQLFSKAGKCPRDDDYAYKKSDMTILKGHKFDQLFSKAGQCVSKDHQMNRIGRSLLKVLKNHKFDELFSKAGQNNVRGNPVHCDDGIPLKILKNHKFDQLFSKAGDHQIPADADFINHTNVLNHKPSISGNDSRVGLQKIAKISRSHNDSGIGLGNVSANTSTNHRFDEIFKTANTANLKDGTRDISQFSEDDQFLLTTESTVNSTSPIKCRLLESGKPQHSSFFTSEFQLKSQNTLNEEANVFPSLTETSDTNPLFLFANEHDDNANCQKYASVLQRSSPNKQTHYTPEGNKRFQSTSNNSFSKIKMQVSKEIDEQLPRCAPKDQDYNFNAMCTSDLCHDRPKKYDLQSVLKRVNSDFSENLKANVQHRPVITSGATSFCQKQVQEALGKPAKRRLGVGSASSSGKRPKIQQSVNIEEMLKAGMLNKVNVPTLTSWLNSNGVATSSRLKKDELIAKVKFQVMLTGNGLKGGND